MGSKWRPLFFFSLTAWTVVSVSFAQTGCQRPKNALKITREQLTGTWSNQMNDNVNNLPKACDRLVFEFLNKASGFATSTYIREDNGQFNLMVYKTTIIDDELVRLQSINFPKDYAFTYIYYINKNEYVASVCYFHDGILSAPQYTAVLTRSQTTTQAYIFDLLSRAKVSYKEPYFYHNYNECYSLNQCQCKTG